MARPRPKPPVDADGAWVPRFWIDHPAAENPVGAVRWLKWHVSQWLGRWASNWERDALYPGWRDDDIPF